MTSVFMAPEPNCSKYLWLLFAVVWLILPISGCGEPPRPMTADEIHAAMVAVPTLYLTEDGDEVIAPGNRRRVVVDEETGKLAFMAFICEHPECPGKGTGKNGRPFLFIWPDPFAYVENGEVKIRLVQTEEDFRKQAEYADMACPECLKTRDLKTEPVQETMVYNGAIKPYVLPESKAELEKLEAAYQKFLERKAELKKQLEGG
jgi:hypothetical protein